MLHAALAREVMGEAVALVGQPFRRAIGRCRHGAAPPAAGDGFHGQMIDGHDATQAGQGFTTPYAAKVRRFFNTKR